MLLNNRNDKIDAVFRSLDDVEYLPVFPSDNAPSMENEILEISAEFEYMMKDVNANDMNERDFQNYNSASDEDSVDLGASKKELPVSTPNNGNNDLENNKMELPIDSNDVQHEVPATAAASEVNVSSLATSSSVVWKHATLAKNKESWSCNHCEKVFKYSKNTTNIITHLKNIHPLLFQYRKKTGKTAKSKNNTKRPSMAVSTNRIENCFKRIESFKNGCENDKITNSILFMICKDMLPLNLTAKLGFQAFVKIVAPLYQIPSPKSIVQKLENKYDFFKDKLVNDLENSISY
uniref:BED-type domain-containing protein n=1 Tax=Trichogramma kaykai TaxID=54128 RepID=A0ABD2WLS6_9HYME